MKRARTAETPRKRAAADVAQAMLAALEESWQDLSAAETEVLRRAALSTDAVRWLRTQTAIMLNGLVEHGKKAGPKQIRSDGGTPEGKHNTPTADTPVDVPEPIPEERAVLPPWQRAEARRLANERRAQQAKFRW
eukprot:CAMPEP_0198649586 /NCGR_PEP_ID=MMETSP1467-20131203/4370_1 /TAXON_ID=1462469 /ORGANISM="unid. sp., Strain CCMP2135" /LENGTH=134 /DNA_ID=CAMNT_0044385383 /DNA_START=187 /DNA_END=591 /DNA_ORIENTATION=+